MARKYTRKTPKIDKEKMKAAVLAVLRDKVSVRRAVDIYGVKRSTLQNWLKNNTAEEAEGGNVKQLSQGVKTV